jgi:hypothetical protein
MNLLVWRASFFKKFVGRHRNGHFPWLWVDKIRQRKNRPVDDPDNDRKDGQEAEQARHVSFSAEKARLGVSNRELTMGFADLTTTSAPVACKSLSA